VSSTKYKLGIEHKIEIGNVHRFGKRYNDRPIPIVARLLYLKDLRMVLDQATWLKNTPFGIHQQFPKSIEDKRLKLYPVLKDAKRQGTNAMPIPSFSNINVRSFLSTSSVGCSAKFVKMRLFFMEQHCKSVTDS
jgi:hypothetical protein